MDSNNKTLIKNSVFLYLRMFIVMAVGLYTSRLVLDALGVEDYGIYNVVGSVVTMLIFLNVAMTTSTQRFLSVELGKGDYDSLAKAFSVSLVIHFVIALFVVLLCETVGVWFLYHKMSIPDSRVDAAFWALQLSILTTFLSIISVPYNALIISHEKMNAFAIISIVDVILKLLICYVLYLFDGDRLVLYASLMALVQLIDRCLYWGYCRKHFVESKFKLFLHSPFYKKMLSFASWVLLPQFAYVCNTSGQNLLLNTFFTPVINAARGIAVQVNSAVQQFSSNFQMAVSPQITKSYASGDYERTYMLVVNSSRFSVYLLYICSLPIILKVHAILSLWLVEVPNYTAIFLQLTLVDGIVHCLYTPIDMVVNAHGKMKIPGIVNGILMIIVLPISYFCLLAGLSPTSVFIVQIIMTYIILFARLIIAKHYCGLSIRTYYKSVLFRPFVVICISLLPPVVWSYTLGQGDGFLPIITTAIISMMSVGITILFIGLSNSERSLLLVYIKNKISFISNKK